MTHTTTAVLVLCGLALAGCGDGAETTNPTRDTGADGGLDAPANNDTARDTATEIGADTGAETDVPREDALADAGDDGGEPRDVATGEDAELDSEPDLPETPERALPGLVIHLDFDDSAGDAVVHDSSGGGSDAHVAGGDTPTTDALHAVDGHDGGAAFHFGVGRPHVELEANPRIETASSGALSASLWLKFDGDSTGDFQTLLGTGDGGWVINKPDHLSSLVFGTWQQESGLVVVQGSQPVDDGQWHHVVAVARGDTISLTIDGHTVDNHTSGALDNLFDSRVLVGASANPEGRPWVGLIDDVRLYDRALDPSEIVHLGRPAQAWDPSPADGDAAPGATSLSWRSGVGAASHDVYMARSRRDVATAQPTSPAFLGNTRELSWEVGALENDVDVYWAIDERDARGALSSERQVWHFSTIPLEATIWDAQRLPFFAAGEVTVEGDRFKVGGVDFYPKTDFLTAVAPGTDLISYTTHCYLSQSGERRATIRDALVASGYNSIFLYTLNQGDYDGGGNVVTPYGTGGFSFDTSQLNAATIATWQGELDTLIREAQLKPFLWLAADDSGAIASAPMARWREYVDDMVEAFEAYPILWVLGLEVDEYWSSAEVAERRAYLQSRTSHPVGVHLTITETHNSASSYRDGFDYIMVQFNSPQSNSQYVSDVHNTLSSGRPTIAAEFNVVGTGSGGEAEATVTARSQAIGAVIAGEGSPSRVAGIGNGIRLH